MVKTNIVVLKKSRKPVFPGDIFVIKLKQLDKYIYGRVIRIDAMIKSIEECTLIYIYNAFSSVKEEIPVLDKTKLLVNKPILTSEQCWMKGYFETVKNQPLKEGDVFPKHCFLSLDRKYYDEDGNVLPIKFEPCGIYGLDNFRTIDDYVSDALGIPVIEED